MWSVQQFRRSCVPYLQQGAPRVSRFGSQGTELRSSRGIGMSYGNRCSCVFRALVSLQLARESLLDMQVAYVAVHGLRESRSQFLRRTGGLLPNRSNMESQLQEASPQGLWSGCIPTLSFT